MSETEAVDWEKRKREVSYEEVWALALNNKYLAQDKMDRIEQLEQQLAEAQQENTRLDERLAQALTDLSGIKRLFEDEREGRIQYQEQSARLLDKIKRQEEELRIVAAQRQDKQAQLAEARALLEQFAAIEPIYRTQTGDHCNYCNSAYTQVVTGQPWTITHTLSCVWVKARAFLHKQSG